MKAPLSIPAAKIKMLAASQSCLVFGLLGLLPVIGLPFALFAGWRSGQARALEKQHWNPAHEYRILGSTCAVVGVLVWGCVDIFFGWRLCDSYIKGSF
jgi:hypothetical protein